MSYTPDDTLEILRKMRMNLSQLQGQVTDVMNSVAQFAAKLPANEVCYVCPQCGVRKASAEYLVDHLANVHGEVAEPVLDSSEVA
jgi:hypothetical protein